MATSASAPLNRLMTRVASSSALKAKLPTARSASKRSTFQCLDRGRRATQRTTHPTTAPNATEHTSWSRTCPTTLAITTNAAKELCKVVLSPTTSVNSRGVAMAMACGGGAPSCSPCNSLSSPNPPVKTSVALRLPSFASRPNGALPPTAVSVATSIFLGEAGADRPAEVGGASSPGSVSATTSAVTAKRTTTSKSVTIVTPSKV
mmetsp:Transcript_957/g.3264  ORF Transcript_957/g.3264 Transcript_957/m.3264 type:complete len:205 (+) Transcript_957:1254-1868(+)